MATTPYDPPPSSRSRASSTPRRTASRASRRDSLFDEVRHGLDVAEHYADAAGKIAGEVGKAAHIAQQVEDDIEQAYRPGGVRGGRAAALSRCSVQSYGGTTTEGETDAEAKETLIPSRPSRVSTKDALYPRHRLPELSSIGSEHRISLISSVLHRAVRVGKHWHATTQETDAVCRRSRWCFQRGRASAGLPPPSFPPSRFPDWPCVLRSTRDKKPSTPSSTTSSSSRSSGTVSPARRTASRSSSPAAPAVLRARARSSATKQQSLLRSLGRQRPTCSSSTNACARFSRASRRSRRSTPKRRMATSASSAPSRATRRSIRLLRRCWTLSRTAPRRKGAGAKSGRRRRCCDGSRRTTRIGSARGARRRCCRRSRRPQAPRSRRPMCVHSRPFPRFTTLTLGVPAAFVVHGLVAARAPIYRARHGPPFDRPRRERH